MNETLKLSTVGNFFSVELQRIGFNGERQKELKMLKKVSYTFLEECLTLNTNFLEINTNNGQRSDVE